MQALLNHPLDMNLGLSFTCNYVVFKLIVYRNLFFFLIVPPLDGLLTHEDARWYPCSSTLITTDS